MSNLFRRPSISKSIKARTTAKYKRQLKKKLIPGYGRKGAGVIKNPKKSMYNAIYSRTTIDTRKKLTSKKRNEAPKTSTDEEARWGVAAIFIFAGMIIGALLIGPWGFLLGLIVTLLIIFYLRFSNKEKK